MEILVINGPNLNMLGKRDPHHYGTLTLSHLEQQLIDFGRSRDIDVYCRQTNSEAECLEMLHEYYGKVNCGLIINAGAWTHYNYAIRDALDILECPKVEVHLSDISTREAFRQVSVIRDVVDIHFQGEKEQSYINAIKYIEGVLL